MKCIIQVHPLSSTVLIPIGLLLLLNYYILARSSTFHFNFPYWAAAATLVNLKVNKVFNKFQKLKNIGLNQSFFSSSVQFSTIFDFNSKLLNRASRCSLDWGIFYLHGNILYQMRNAQEYSMFYEKYSMFLFA